MRTHDVAFASRPLSATVRLLTNGGRDIIFAPYGDQWRQLRKVAITELLSARRVLPFRRAREEEVSSMLRAVLGAAGAGAAVDMHVRLAALVSDTSARVVFGDGCKDRDMFLQQVEHGNKIGAGFNPADLWPSSWLARCLSTTVRRAEACRNTVYGILDGIINEHLERIDDGGGAGEAEDLLSVLLKIQMDDELQIPLDMDVVKGVVFDLFAAGSETSVTALEWIMPELIKNLKAMERATTVVRNALAVHDTMPEHALSEFRYLHLVIRDTFRLHPPAPLLL
ncbi:unnamed protein product [Urochloa humidicola]